MAGDTYGRLFTVTTFGESHGPAMGCVVDGCPPGLPLAESDIQRDLDRRRPGRSRHVTQRNEPDQVKILSGVFEGARPAPPSDCWWRTSISAAATTRRSRTASGPGTPTTRISRSTAFATTAAAAARRRARRSCAWRPARSRASISRATRPQDSRLSRRDRAVQAARARSRSRGRQSVLLCRSDKLPQLDKFMDELRGAGDSIGARINLIASGVPVGLGRARIRQARGRDRQGLDEHQRGQRRRVWRRLRVRAAARQRASRRAHAGRLQEELVGRHARRNLERPGHPRQHRSEADVEHPSAGRPSTRTGARPRS